MRGGLGLGLSLALTSLAVGAGVTYSAEATALFARFTTPPTDARKALIDALIVSLKTSGVWAKLDALYLTAAETAQAARQNWVADLYNLSTVNSPAFVADRGYSGDGSSSYLSSGVAPNALVKYTLNDAGEFIWIRTNSASGTQIDAGTLVGLNNLIRTRNATDQLVTRSNNGTSTSTAGATTSVGLSATSRAGSASYDVYKDGASLGNIVSASTALATDTMTTLAGAGAFSSRQVAARGFGASLTALQEASLYSALNTHLQAIGAA